MTVCLDEAIGAPMAQVLRMLRAPAAAHLCSVAELGLRGKSDDVLLPELGRRGCTALVTFDSSMLRASVRHDAWRASGVSVFLWGGDAGNLSKFEKARTLIWRWPAIVEQIEAGPRGGAWHVPLDPRKDGLTRLYPTESDSI